MSEFSIAVALLHFVEANGGHFAQDISQITEPVLSAGLQCHRLVHLAFLPMAE